MSWSDVLSFLRLKTTRYFERQTKGRGSPGSRERRDRSQQSAAEIDVEATGADQIADADFGKVHRARPSNGGRFGVSFRISLAFAPAVPTELPLWGQRNSEADPSNHHEIAKTSMKRTSVFRYEILGSMCEWPVIVDLSRNERAGHWTLYFRFVDPEARHEERVVAHTASELYRALVRQYVSVPNFADAISQNAGWAEYDVFAAKLTDLAADLRALKPREEASETIGDLGENRQQHPSPAPEFPGVDLARALYEAASCHGDPVPADGEAWLCETAGVVVAVDLDSYDRQDIEDNLDATVSKERLRAIKRGAALTSEEESRVKCSIAIEDESGSGTSLVLYSTCTEDKTLWFYVQRIGDGETRFPPVAHFAIISLRFLNF